MNFPLRKMTSPVSNSPMFVSSSLLIGSKTLTLRKAIALGSFLSNLAIAVTSLIVNSFVKRLVILCT